MNSYLINNLNLNRNLFKISFAIRNYEAEVKKSKNSRNEPIQSMKNSKTRTSDTINLNEFGVQMISENFRQKLFGKNRIQSLKDDELIKSAKKNLKKFNLLGNKTDLLTSVENLELPELNGENIEEHFENILSGQGSKYFRIASNLAIENLPNMPKEFVYKSGWTRQVKKNILIKSLFRNKIQYFI